MSNQHKSTARPFAAPVLVRRAGRAILGMIGLAGHSAEPVRQGAPEAAATCCPAGTPPWMLPPWQYRPRWTD